jgi:hypothetical protein
MAKAKGLPTSKIDEATGWKACGSAATQRCAVCSDSGCDAHLETSDAGARRCRACALEYDEKRR